MSQYDGRTTRLRLVTGGTAPRPQGTERKRRRLAATITDRLAARPRLAMPLPTAPVFDGPAWRERWARIRHGGEVVGCYVAGCAGSLKLGQLLGCPWPKLGTGIDVERRIDDLNRERYGALRVRGFEFVEEDGWSDWKPARFSARPTHPASPVRVLPRQLEVQLPPWVSAQDFEALFNAALEPVSLPFVVARPAGRDLLRSRGREVDDALRYSRSARGPVLVTELTSFGPSADAARLIAAIEWTLIRLVLADVSGER